MAHALTRILAAAALGIAAAAPALAEPKLGLRTGGASDELTGELRAALRTQEMLNDGRTNAQDLTAAAREDYRRLLAVLYDQGYFGPAISITLDGQEAATIPPLGAPREIDVIIVRVDPGPRFAFGRAALAPLPPGVPVPGYFQPGRTARTERIEKAAEFGITSWRELGYAKARLAAQQITARHPAQQLDVSLQLDPGPRLRFGTLDVSGNRDVGANRIRQIAGLPTGQVFDPDEVERAATRLRRTGAFRSVALSEAESIGPGNTLDIEAQVLEEKPRRFGFGAEVSTQEGAALTAFWLHRNLLGGAERLRIEGSVSGIDSNTTGIDYRLSARFDRPATFGADTDFYALAVAESLDEPRFDADQAQIEIGIDRIVSEDLTLSAGVGLRYAQVDDAFGSRDFTQVYMPLEATLDRRDEPLDPAQGYYLNAVAMPFAGLDGRSSGARLRSDARLYRGFGEKRRMVLAGRLQLGSILGPGIEDTLPGDLFYSGGGGTVRGQDYQSLGVTLPDGRRTGGLSFVGLSAELRAQVTPKGELVGFYDAGFVGETALPGETGDWHSGAGIGLRYDTGIGPIRLDIATPASGGDAGQSVHFYIGIGQAF